MEMHVCVACSYLLLLSADLCLCQAVSFGKYGNYVDLLMQGLHTLHIQRSQTVMQPHVCECTPRTPQLSGGAVDSVASLYALTHG